MMDLPIEDLSIDWQIAEVYTSKSDFVSVRKSVVELGYHISEADIHFFAENQISLTGGDRETFEHILEILHDDEDVDQVYHNLAL